MTRMSRYRFHLPLIKPPREPGKFVDPPPGVLCTTRNSTRFHAYARREINQHGFVGAKTACGYIYRRPELVKMDSLTTAKVERFLAEDPEAMEFYRSVYCQKCADHHDLPTALRTTARYYEVRTYQRRLTQARMQLKSLRDRLKTYDHPAPVLLIQAVVQALKDIVPVFKKNLYNRQRFRREVDRAETSVAELERQGPPNLNLLFFV